MTVLILIILVLVIVVAIKDQDKDAKIAEVDKKATDSILKRQKNGLRLGTVRLVNKNIARIANAVQVTICLLVSTSVY